MRTWIHNIGTQTQRPRMTTWPLDIYLMMEMRTLMRRKGIGGMRGLTRKHEDDEGGGDL